MENTTIYPTIEDGKRFSLEVVEQRKIVSTTTSKIGHKRGLAEGALISGKYYVYYQ